MNAFKTGVTQMVQAASSTDVEVVGYLKQKIRFWVSLNGDQRPPAKEYYAIMVDLLENVQDIPMSHIPVADQEATFAASFMQAYAEERFPITVA